VKFFWILFYFTRSHLVQCIEVWAEPGLTHMGWAIPSQPGPVTSPSQWPGWAKQHACTKFTRVATLFKWIKIHLNSVMLIMKQSRREWRETYLWSFAPEDERWKLSAFLAISLFCSFSYQCLLGAGVGWQRQWCRCVD